MPPVPISIEVDDNKILHAIRWACCILHFSIDRPGLNTRELTEKLDDKIMGDVATAAVLQYLSALGVPAVAYDQVRTDDYKLPDPGWDIVIGVTRDQYPDLAAGQLSLPSYTASVRSSRTVGTKSVEQCIQAYDFKIFALPGKSLSQCITAGLEIQVYYDIAVTELGSLRVTQGQIDRCIQRIAQCREIADALQVRQRYGRCYLTAWNTKEAIVSDVVQLTSQTWSNRGKLMWRAPLVTARSMPELANLYRVAAGSTGAT